MSTEMRDFQNHVVQITLQIYNILISVSSIGSSYVFDFIL